MENTVTISLNEYDELREFKNKISEGYTISSNKFWPYNKYITTNEAIINISKDYETQIIDISEEHENQINEMKNKYESMIEKLENEIKEHQFVINSVYASSNEKLNKNSFNFWKKNK